MAEPTDSLALQPHLLPGESVRWIGRPNPDRLFSSGDVFLVPFSLMWGGFALFWEASVLGAGLQSSPGGAWWFGALWGIPFVLIGQYFIWGRFLYRRWDRRRTIYAITDQRVLALRGSTLQSLFLNQLPTLDKSQRADGSGTLEFTSSPFGFGFWGNTGMEFMSGRRSSSFAFYDIPDVNDVFRLVAEGRTATAGG
jgi:hypothetical protein